MAGELILITGVSGYIGFKTLRMALQQNYKVRAIVRKHEQAAALKSHSRIAELLDDLEFMVVPDMARAGAFDSVLDGVSVLHLASPLAKETGDYDRDVVRPAIDIESSILSSALKTPSIRRVVITSSAVTLMPMSWLSATDTSKLFDSTDINTDTAGPYHDPMEAYWASKAIARTHVHEFLAEHKPHFSIIQILPSVVIGPDDLATDLATLQVGTRAMVLPVFQGSKIDTPLVGTPVLADDVARAHVDAIKPSIPGNRDYILSSDAPEGIEWNDMDRITRKYYPKEVASGLITCGGSLSTRKWRLDTSGTEATFGWRCTSFEGTVRRLLEQYIEFLKKARATS